MLPILEEATNDARLSSEVRARISAIFGVRGADLRSMARLSPNNSSTDVSLTPKEQKTPVTPLEKTTAVVTTTSFVKAR